MSTVLTVLNILVSMDVKKTAKGFSLIELVTVILLLGIVTAVILPRFTSRDGLAEYAIRDQFISAYRFAQQRAMYDQSGACYSVNVDSNGFRPYKDGAAFSGFEAVDFSAGDFSGLSLDLGGNSSFSVYFDGLGNAYTQDCNITVAGNPSVLTIPDTAVTVEIFSTGFIQ